jgi:hypothetical protein
MLKDVPELSCGDPGSGNLIVEGDNLVVALNNRASGLVARPATETDAQDAFEW